MQKDFPGGTVESACQCRRQDWISGSGRSPGVENGSPLQYSCLGNSMDRGAWWDTWGSKQSWDDWATHINAKKKKNLPLFLSWMFWNTEIFGKDRLFFCRLSFNLDFYKISSWLYTIYTISWQNKSRGHIVCFPGHHIRSHMMSLCPIIGNVNFTVVAIRFFHCKVTIFVESFIESR